MRENKVKPVKEFISISKAMEKTGLGKDWFYRHIKNNTLPFNWKQLSERKKGFDSVGIDNWLKNNKHIGSLYPQSTDDIIKSIRGPLLNISEAAKILNVSRAEIYVMINKNIIPYHQINGSKRLDSADINDYLFFSKFGGNTSLIKKSDKVKIIEQVEERHAQFKKSLEQVLGISLPISEEAS